VLWVGFSNKLGYKPQQTSKQFPPSQLDDAVTQLVHSKNSGRGRMEIGEPEKWYESCVFRGAERCGKRFKTLIAMLNFRSHKYPIIRFYKNVCL